MANEPYRLALGDSYDALADGVRRSHEPPLCATGTVEVLSPGNSLARLICHVLKLPKVGPPRQMTLKVSTSGDFVNWDRNFGGLNWLTRHTLRSGFVDEQNCRALITFRLFERDGNIHYETASSRVCGIPIPALLNPKIKAVTSPEGASWKTHVVVKLPVLGVICEYEAKMNRVD